MGPIEILDEAVSVARRKGYHVEGWFICRDDEGYAAWLYVLRGHSYDEEPLWREAELVETLAEAAGDCLTRAAALPDAPRAEAEA